MAYQGAKYLSKVMNRSGFIIELPNVADLKELIQSNPPNPYAESSTQLFPVGTKIKRGVDSFRYTKNGGTALNIAAPTQQAKPAHAEQDDDIVVGAAAAIGATTVELTSTANLDTAPNETADDFKEGYLIVNDAAGEGQLYQIKANEAFSGTADSTFTLYDALTVALTTSSQVGLVRHPFYKTIATEAVVSGMFTGVPLMAVTADYWYWSKTNGPTPCVTQAAIALGTLVVIGTTAAKVDPIGTSGDTEIIIGEAMTPGVADTESCIVYLRGDS